jgi:hypothetical protein
MRLLSQTDFPHPTVARARWKPLGPGFKGHRPTILLTLGIEKNFGLARGR